MQPSFMQRAQRMADLHIGAHSMIRSALHADFTPSSKLDIKQTDSYWINT